MANRDFEIELKLRTQFEAAQRDLERARKAVADLHKETAKGGAPGFAKGASTEVRGLEQALRSGTGTARDFRAALNGGGSNAAAFLGGMAASVLSVAVAFQSLRGAIDYADKLNDFTIRLGVSAEQMSAWAYAARQTGTDVDGLSVGLKKLQLAMAAALDPKSDKAKLFGALGVSVTDASGKLKTLEQIVPEVATAFKSLNDDALKTKVAVELFGKSGTDLIEFLQLGGAGLAKMGDKARQLGLVMSQETLTAADGFKDSLDDLRGVTEGYVIKITAGLLPALQGAIVGLVDSANSGDKLEETGQALGTTLSYVADAGTVMVRAVKAIAMAAAEAAVQMSYLNQAGNQFTAGHWGEALATLKAADGQLKQYNADLVAMANAPTIGQAMRSAPHPSPRGALFRDVMSDPAEIAAYEDSQKRSKRLQEALDRALSGKGAGGGGGRRPGKGGGGGGTSPMQQALQDADRAIAQMKEEIALQATLSAGETKVSEAAKVRYEIENGRYKLLNQAKKNELIAAAEAVDASNKDIEAKRQQAEDTKKVKDAYQQLRDELRTPAEVAVDGAIAKLHELNAAVQANLDGAKEFAADAQQRIVKGLTDKQPQFQGLAPEVGGAVGELQKIQTARDVENKWYSESLAAQRAYQAQKGADIAAANAQIEDIERKHQQVMAAIDGASNTAKLSIAGEVFGQIAQLSQSHNAKMAAIGKAAAVAEATIQGILAVQKALATSAPPYNYILAAAAAATAGANVAKIISTPTGYATGGYTGAGGKYEPAGIVHRGEGVLSQEEIAALGGPGGFHALRAAIDDGAMHQMLYGWTGYADGGMVASSGPSLPALDLSNRPSGATFGSSNNRLSLYNLFDADALAERVAMHPAMEKKIVTVASENGQAIRASW